MNILITGGAGFIGSHLSDYFLREGNHVAVIDDLSTGSVENIRDAKKSTHFEYHLDTIFNDQLTAELIDGADVVFHLAAAVGVRNVVDSPVRTMETNVRGAQLVLELSSKKSKRVLMMSSSEVYGKSAKVPFLEDDDLVLGPTSKARWGYACSKMMDEFLGLAYYRERKLPVTIVRLFNTVGPRQTGRYGMVLPTFVQQALAGNPVTVFGSGKQSRCFTHVADVIEGLAQCAMSDCTVGQVFNLGNTEEITVNALAERIVVATQSKSRVDHIPYEEAYGSDFEDMDRRVPDISKASKWFGYKPSHSLADIIDSVVDYYRGRARISTQAAADR